jgi:hypothetical protein
LPCKLKIDVSDCSDLDRGFFITIILEKLQDLSLSLDNAKLRFPSERIPSCVLFWVSTFRFLMQKRWTRSRYLQDPPITYLTMLHFAREKNLVDTFSFKEVNHRQLLLLICLQSSLHLTCVVHCTTAPSVFTIYLCVVCVTNSLKIQIQITSL